MTAQDSAPQSRMFVRQVERCDSRGSGHCGDTTVQDADGTIQTELFLAAS